MKHRFMLLAMMAGLLASCADSIGESPDTGPTTKPADGKYAVGFNAYARRGTTRAGYAGVLNLGQLEETELNGGGFGVFAYYTDLKKYDQTYIPNFMYNQGVFKNGSNWEYSPVMYWPNESGLDAQSDDEDKVTFFAYAPYVKHSSAASGSVADATYGITGFSRNTTAGDPIVKYIASFDPTKSVDLCWGVCADASWPKFQDAGTQTMTSGLPWLDVEHPQGVDQKMTFTFRHALSQLNVQIDADPDINSHDESAEIATGTKVYVRSISFTGIAMQAALNLNNVEADKPLWLDYSGTTDLPYGQSVTVHDGRRDGREGATGAEATNELPQGLNPAIVQNSVATAGVTHQLVNLFNGAVTTPVYVIPTGEKMTVTIVYDVETANDDLPGYLSDGVNHGSSIENRITRDIAWSNSVTGLESGKQYTLKLHLGLNSVKFDATVSAWDDDAVSGNGWLPSNLAVTTPVTLSLGTSLSMQMSGGSGTPQTLTATTQPSGASVTWSNSNDAVATIAPAGGVSPAPSRRAAQENVGPCSSIVITPVAAGTTIVTATSAYGSAQCIVTVTDESTEAVSITLNKSATTLYATESETLTATTDPTPRTVTWVSSNTAAATVNSSGEVTAVNAGVTYITATSPSGNAASCEVTVLPTVLTLSDATKSMTVGQTYTLTGTTTPLGKTITFTSDNSTVASVDANTGEITANVSGTATITATILGGGSATCTVTVSGTMATVTTAPVANTLTYNGSAQALVSAGTASNGTMQYATGTSSAPAGWSASIPTATDVGTYYVWYRAHGTGDYTDSDPVMLTVTINAGVAVTPTVDDWGSGGDVDGTTPDLHL